MEAMSVYRLYENENIFLFNQTSAVNFDNRTTLNVGLGVRHINDAETLIVGGNSFYDYELDSEHKRLGFGIEFITSVVELRANQYKAQTGQINHDGIDETALDGNDLKLVANMPYFYSSNLFLSTVNSKMASATLPKPTNGVIRLKSYRTLCLE